jgi:hypothetical protein
MSLKFKNIFTRVKKLTKQTYIITTISVEQLDEMIVSNRADLIDESACGKTYTGFTLIEEGSWAGSYRGIADGEEAIFYADEVQNATPES